MAQKKNVICIIPARGGSKRIKNKNIIDFFGKPLISYSINVAIQSKLFDKIIVSTDSPKISNIAKKYGAEVPFLRSKKLSNDFTGTNDVLIDTVNRIAAYDAKYVFCIYPTAPLITVDDLKKAFYKIKKKKYDCIIATNIYNFNPLRCFKITKDKIEFKWKNFANKRSQDLENLIHDSGTFYIYKTKYLLRSKVLMSKNTSYYSLNKFKAVDINNFEDLDFAKFLYRYNYLRNKI
jgi:N-acylneuraminate cytidylyltransferase